MSAGDTYPEVPFFLGQVLQLFGLKQESVQMTLRLGNLMLIELALGHLMLIDLVLGHLRLVDLV